eukprot:8720688-Pyramimonas_sp.AAC.1
MMKEAGTGVPGCRSETLPRVRRRLAQSSLAAPPGGLVVHSDPRYVCVCVCWGGRSRSIDACAVAFVGE